MTLIDKAEALLPCPFCGGEAELWNARDNRPAWIGCMGRCAVLISKEHTTDAEAIAAWNRRALPARGVGVKPLVWQPIVKGARRPVGLVLLYRKSVTAEDKLVAAICKGTPEASDEILLGKWRDGAWRQWNTGWTVNGVTHWMPLPEPPEILAALAPTDAPDLSDPVTVHANMLRGSIAKPTVEQIVHLYGVDTLAKALAPVIVREAAPYMTDLMVDPETIPDREMEYDHRAGDDSDD